MTATATSVVTTGAKSAVRNAAWNRVTLEWRRSAVPNDTPIDSGTPTTTK
jgi:hypothetical protein